MRKKIVINNFTPIRIDNPDNNSYYPFKDKH